MCGKYGALKVGRRYKAAAVSHVQTVIESVQPTLFDRLTGQPAVPTEGVLSVHIRETVLW